jgi:hypothetical protein
VGELHLMTLREAAAFIGGGLTASSLRKEIASGRLIPAKIAGRYLVEEADLRAMVARCRVGVNQSRQDSTSGRVGVVIQSGRSLTGPQSAGLAAAKATARELKKHSQTTSPENTAPLSAQVIPIK